MKKRLLITSIVMMLVVAVALSTATYAWFTSNTQVTASTISMTAAVNQDAALAIKWGHASYQTSITTTQSYDELAPMIPNEIAAGTTTLGFTTATHNISFQTAKIHTKDGDSQFFNVSNSANAVAFRSESTSTGYDEIWIQNTSTANSIYNLKVSATITPTLVACETGEKAVAGYTYYSSNDVASKLSTQPTAGAELAAGTYKAAVDLIRIAVFTKDLTAAGTNDAATAYTLRGILANSESATYFGTIANNDSQTDFKNSANAVKGTKNFTGNTVNATAAATGFNICYDGSDLKTLAPQGEIAIKVIMWLDGEALNDDTQGAIATVGLTFDPVSAPAQQQEPSGD